MPTEIPTVEIPADIYDGTLAWCNERRAEDGKEPLAELPEGNARSPYSCPCGKACNWAVFLVSAHRDVDNDMPLPIVVQQFVSMFDHDGDECRSGAHLPIRGKAAAK